MRIQTIIIDDDQLNIDLLSALLKTYCPQVEIPATATNVEEGVQAIVQHRPQLLFLDMELHNQIGFEILDSLPQLDMQVVLVTAHEKYAVQAFRYEVTDYLLKPIKIEELVQAISKVEKNLHEIYKSKAPQRISVSEKNHTELIPVEDILYIEAHNSVSAIITKDNKSHTSTKRFRDFEPLLINTDFMRVHKSYIINCKYVIGFTKHRPPMIAMSNGKEIPLSASAKAELQARLSIL